MKARVYRCYNKDGDLLYIGCSVNVFARLYDHSRISVWYDATVRITLDDPLPRREALAAEKKAIIEEGPRFNSVRGNDITKMAWNE